MSTKETGPRGEALAEAFLKKQGYKIIERNFRCRYGEIDIIAYRKKVLSFVEVKSRLSDEMGLPIESITKDKQKKLIKTANYYLLRNKIPSSVPCQFDVVSIIMGKEPPDIEFITNAF